MDYIKETKDISAEEAIILWQASRLSLSKSYEKAPEILSTWFRHRNIGEFQRIHRQSQEQENLQCIGYRSRCIEERYRVTICG